MARPKANIDWTKVDKMLQAHCDGVSIAGLLGIDCETLYRRCESDNNVGFSEYSAQKRGEGKELIRLKQFEVAMTGDKTMLIWLGKQYAGQSDKTENKNEHSIASLPSWMQPEASDETKSEL